MSSPQPAARSIAGVWRALSGLDRILLLLLLICGAAGFAIQAGSLSLLGRLFAYVLAFWLALRLVRRFVRHIIWRLRNRLLVAYAFIALVPILLIVALAGLVMYAIVGQMAVYTISAEMEKRTALMISAAQWLAEEETARRLPAAEQAYPVLAARLPGLTLMVQSQQSWTYPPDAAIEVPPKDWGDAGGLVVKDGLLFAWAHIVRKEATATLLLPLTPRFLASLAPNIGEITFLRLDEDATQPRRRLRLHRSAGEAEESVAPRNRLPDPENRFDIEVRWPTAVPAFVWERPGRVENELMRVRTRPFAVLNTVFAQKVDRAQGIIPALLITFSIGFLIAEIIAIAIGVSITRTITGAVHDLYEGTQRVQESDFSHRIRIKGRDQLASLGASFNSMTANLERLLVVAKEKERLQTELEIAREVQSQLYPHTIPEMKTLRLTAACNPARMVSGDYYDYQRLDESRLAIAIGDVAGKGISAALLMATVQSALRTQIRHCLETHAGGVAPVSTSALVTQINQHLYAHTTPEKFATFCFGVYDEATGVLTYTNAGHLPPILLRDGRTQTLEVNGIVVGAFPFSRYQESQIRLEPGDLLLFYTDGITEPENAYGEQFGEERVLDVLSRNKDCAPEEILSLIIERVREWTGSSELQDDMTLLLAQRHAG